MSRTATIALLVATLALVAGPARAQAGKQPRGPLAGVGFDQRLDEQIPLDLVFRDEHGARVRLGDYFGERPVLLSLVYFDCRMLCSYVLDGEVRALTDVSLDAGVDFDVVIVSFDPSDTPAKAMRVEETYAGRYGRDGGGAGWHVLTGDRASIDALASAVGFRYRRDDEGDQFAHAAGLMVATPAGRLSRYFYGVDYPASDLRLALVEASDGTIGSPVDQLLLYCCRYDPATGRYGVVIMKVIRLAGGATLALLGGLIGLLALRDRRRRRRERTAPASAEGRP